MKKRQYDFSHFVMGTCACFYLWRGFVKITIIEDTESTS